MLPHSKEFRRTISYIKENPFVQLIEYIGNEKVYKPRPWGNAKDKTAGEYHRTKQSVIKKINDNLSTGCSVSCTYTKLVRECSESDVQGVLNPRNREQVKNLQKQINAKKCISRDDMYNWYALALELDDFI